MKRILLCLIGIAAFGVCAADKPNKAVQPFSAVTWTTTTVHSPKGKAFIFTRRTVYTRDATGNTRSEIYKPTKGLGHDTAAPLERVLTGTASAQTLLPTGRSSKETLEQEADLGTSQFSGFPTAGKRQTFKNTNGERTRTQEAWFCPTLGLTVHMESSNARGDTTVSDLSELSLGSPAAPVGESAATTAAAPAIPLLVLYRGLFTHIAHMERDRLANDPNFHANMAEIEEHLRKAIDLSAREWQTLVATSVKVEGYSHEKSKEAHSFAEQDKAARRENPQGPNTLAAGRAKLHQMQLDLNAHVQGDIDQLKTDVGSTAVEHIQAYLQGPLAASTQAVSVKSVRLQAQQAVKEQAR